MFLVTDGFFFTSHWTNPAFNLTRNCVIILKWPVREDELTPRPSIVERL